jgi:HSP20 family protein
VNKLAVQRQSRPLLPELSELFASFPTFAGLRPLFDGRAMRLEDEMKDRIYEVRAELPGVDPADDIEVTVRDGRLTIKAERTRRSESNRHCGVRVRILHADRATSRGAHEDDINATYDRGILTVSVPLPQDHPTEKRVEIVETIVVDEDDNEEDDEQPQLEHGEDEEQHPPVG